MFKNVAGQHFFFQGIKSADGGDFTDVVTGVVAKDGGTQGAITGSVTHIGGGQYRVAPSQADTNGDALGFKFSATGMISVTASFFTVKQGTSGLAEFQAGVISDGAIVAATIAAAALNGKGDWNIGKTGYDLNADQSSVTIGTTTDVTNTVGANVTFWQGIPQVAVNGKPNVHVSEYASGESPTDAIVAAHLDHLLQVATATFPGVSTSILGEMLERSTTWRYVAEALSQAPTGGGLSPTDTNELRHRLGLSGTKADPGANAASVWSPNATTMIEDSGGDRFTTKALEQAPSGGGGGTDWTAGEREQIRSALGVDGTKTAATGGQLQSKLEPTVAGRTLNVGTDNQAEANLQKWLGTSPNALLSGRVQAQVGAMANNVITAASIAAGALNGKGDWNIGKTGYDLNADQSSVQIGSVVGNVGGSVASVIARVLANTDQFNGSVLAVANAVEWLRTLAVGQAQSGSTAEVIKTNLPAEINTSGLNGRLIVFRDDAGRSREAAAITAYDMTTRDVTVAAGALTGAPAAGENFVIV